jgi:hypothetical protein
MVSTQQCRPEFYSADEAALLVKKQIPAHEFDGIRQYYRAESVRVLMRPGTITKGFVFLPRAVGGRYVVVRLAEDSYQAELRRRDADPNRSGSYLEVRFGFALPLPDGEFDYERLDTAHTYGDSYAVAPASSLHTVGRKQDFALQRARKSISQRNHMRLWLAPFQIEGQQVWVGQVSRDIGIKLTFQSPSLTTHVMDPEVDLTREYLLHSLLAAGFIDRFGFVTGATVATRKPLLHLRVQTKRESAPLRA